MSNRLGFDDSLGSSGGGAGPISVSPRDSWLAQDERMAAGAFGRIAGRELGEGVAKDHSALLEITRPLETRRSETGECADTEAFYFLTHRAAF